MKSQKPTINLTTMMYATSNILITHTHASLIPRAQTKQQQLLVTKSFHQSTQLHFTLHNTPIHSHLRCLGFVLSIEELRKAAPLDGVEGAVIKPGGVAGDDDVVGLFCQSVVPFIVPLLLLLFCFCCCCFCCCLLLK